MTRFGKSNNSQPVYMKVQATYSKHPDGSIKVIIEVLNKGDFPTVNIFGSPCESPTDGGWNLREGTESAIVRTFTTSDEAKRWVSTQIESLNAKLDRWRSMRLEQAPPISLWRKTSTRLLILLLILSAVFGYVFISRDTRKGSRVSTAPVLKKKGPERPHLPSTEEAPGGKTKAALPLNPWVVEVSSFTNFRPAKNLAYQLRSRGYPAFVVKRTIRGERWYRVRAGFYFTEREAQEIRDKIASEFGIKGCWLHLLTQKKVKQMSRIYGRTTT